MSFNVANLIAIPGLSLYAIPVAWVLAAWPHISKNLLINKHIGYDNVNPRENINRFERKQVKPEVIAKARRLAGAHQNGNEILPIWIGAVLAANVAGVDHQFLNKISLAFIVSRAIFNRIYAQHTSIGLARLRSVVWGVSISLPFYLCVKAGNIIRARA